MNLTCNANLSSPSKVHVWETGRVYRVDLGAMGIGLHPTTLLGKKNQNDRT